MTEAADTMSEGEPVKTRAGQQSLSSESAEPEAEATKAEAPKPDAHDAHDPELKVKLARLAELERAESEREKAKLSEAERVKAERAELARDRFRLDLERAGVPSAVAQRFPSAPEKHADRAVAEIAGAWKAELEQAVKAATKTNTESADAAAAVIDPARRPSKGQETNDTHQPYRDMVAEMRKAARRG